MREKSFICNSNLPLESCWKKTQRMLVHQVTMWNCAGVPNHYRVPSSVKFRQLHRCVLSLAAMQAIPVYVDNKIWKAEHTELYTPHTTSSSLAEGKPSTPVCKTQAGRRGTVWGLHMCGTEDPRALPWGSHLGWKFRLKVYTVYPFTLLTSKVPVLSISKNQKKNQPF